MPATLKQNSFYNLLEFSWEREKYWVEQSHPQHILHTGYTSVANSFIFFLLLIFSFPIS